MTRFQKSNKGSTMMTNALHHRIYLWGYAGNALPKWVRRALAGNGLHRAWFLGYSGFFEQDGIRYGLARPYEMKFAPK